MFEERLIVVSGKGGTGKTAIASAIALHCAKEVPTVLVSFDAHLDAHAFFDVPFSYEPVAVRDGLWLMRVDGLSAVREYVRRRVPFAGIYDPLLTSRMFRDFSEAAPGFDELMCLGKLYDLAEDSDFERVIFDAPATGHFKTLVDVPAATLKAVQVGPLNHNARKIQDLLLDPSRTRVVLASLAEEMAVKEAQELEAFCRERRLQVGPTIINQRVESRFADAEIDALERLENPSPALRLGAEVALAEHLLAASQDEALAPLRDAGTHPIWYLPRCIDQEPEQLLEQMEAGIAAAQSDG